MSKIYSPAKKFNHAELLYQILPSVYRERDEKQDLKKYLDGCGLLLDQMHHTLLQRYADIFPDSHEASDIDSQTWLLPYIAALFDVTLVSPLESGQREEIANAISWRKAKGTVNVVEQVAEAVGGMEVIVHEGWKRVATTARIGMPVLPLETYGYMENEDYTNGFQDHQQPDLAPLWARHPGLPAGTVDLRCQASAVAATEDNPAAVVSQVGGKSFRWRQSSLHGAQNCNKKHSVLPFKTLEPDWIPGYFDDPSVRTVDLRNPDWRQGHFHPRRVLLFAATHPGFFAPIPAERHFQWSASLPVDTDFLELVSTTVVEEKDADKSVQKTIFRNKTLDEGPFEAIQIRLKVKPDELPGGTGSAHPPVWRFEGFVFIHTVETASGRLEFDRCALLAANIQTADAEQAVLHADNCLFKKIEADEGLVRLQYCTVMTTTIAEKLQASECIFNGLIQKDLAANTPPGKGCVRYSAILPQQTSGELQFFHHHALQAIFYNEVFGPSGCGVLHPASSAEITNGAEDGGEMGAYHHLHLVARRQAVISKLGDFLPTGMKPVIIPDNSLHELPGEFTESSESE